MALAQRTNDEWLADLQLTGERQASALEDLRLIVLRGLPYALAGKLPTDDARFAPLIEEVAQETLLRVLEYLPTFQGRAAFTTWVHKIAVRQALSELRRLRWRDVPLPEMVQEDDTDRPVREIPDRQPGPAATAERRDLMQTIQQMMTEELTEKQRTALMLVTLHGLPLEEAARRLGTNRNALYKLLHDARVRLKRRLESVGLDPEHMLASFEPSTR